DDAPPPAARPGSAESPAATGSTDVAPVGPPALIAPALATALAGAESEADPVERAVLASIEVAQLPELDPARVTPLPPRALLAQDSISARHTLARLLEERDLEVHAVGTAAELEDALELGPW